MKITLIVLGVILALLSALLFLPVALDLAYKQKFVLKLKISGITIFDNQKKSKRKQKIKKKKTSQNTQTKKQPKDNFFKKTYKQKGLTETVKYFAEILNMLLKKLFWVIKHFKFRKFSLDLVVATPDAANTAIQYGGICSAVYPIIAFLQTNTDFKAKSVNVSADFDKHKSQFEISFLLKTRLLFLVIAAIATLFDFSKIQNKESEKYERKQH